MLETGFQTRAPGSASIRDLETHMLGELIRPEHDDYDAARRVHNLEIERRPQLIARVGDAADVIRAVNFAREHELPLAVRSGGHSMAGHGTVDGGLVIDLGAMQGLSIDARRQTAWAQPGVQWGTYAQHAHQYALGTSAGDVASVGVGGLTLGGGIGWMVRKYGLTIDRLQSVELVTADGRLVRASAEEHPDLFWAVRGGGGNFGVATAFQFGLDPVGTILGGAIVYPASARILRDWIDYAAQAPDELTSIAFVMPAPPAPFIPAELRGQLVAILGVCYVGDPEVGERVVDPLRRLGRPIADITGPMPYPALFSLTEAATQPGYAVGRSGYFTHLDDGLLESTIDHAASMPVPTGMVEVRVLGGAMARVPEAATAFAHRDKPLMVTIVGASPDRAGVEQQRAWTETLWSVLRPLSDGVYANFLGDEGSRRVHEAYTPAIYRRLQAIKHEYDPANLFRMNQNIAPAA